MNVICLCAVLLLWASAAYGELRHVYFGTGGQQSEGIYRAKFDTKRGKILKVQLAAEIKNPGFLAWNASKSCVYAVAQRQKPVVVAYRVEEDGALKEINSTPIGDGGAAHIAVHPSGDFLITAQYGGGSTAVFPLGKDGSVKERSQLLKHEGGSKVVPKRQARPHPHWVGFSPKGDFAFVPDLGMDKIVIYKVMPQGLGLQPHGFATSVAGGGPRHMRFSVDGRYIHLLNELSLSISTFAYDAVSGRGDLKATVPTLSEEVKAQEAFNSASEILVHPNGRWVYSANRGNDSVSVFHANVQTGELTLQEVEPIRGAWPRNIQLDPSGQWLLAAGAHSNTVTVFAIDDQNGRLTYQTRSAVGVPQPICIVFGK